MEREKKKRRKRRRKKKKQQKNGEESGSRSWFQTDVGEGGDQDRQGIRNKEKEKEEEKPEADRNVECKSVDCSLSFQNLQWLLLFPSPVFYSTFPIWSALFSYNFPFFAPIPPLLSSSVPLSLFFLFAQLTLSAVVENPLSRRIS